jgi:hypothetical protein
VLGDGPHYARPISLKNLGGATLYWSIDDGDTWIPLEPGESFDWNHGIYAFRFRTYEASANYCIVYGRRDA